MSEQSLTRVTSSEHGSTKATITVMEEKRPLERITCLFNPKEYTLSKQNDWSPPQGASTQDLPKLNFSGGKPASLQIQLFFDTYETGKDVTIYTQKLWQLMMIDPTLEDLGSTKGRPPRVLFQWGPTKFFTAVITSLNQKVTLFLPNGMPVRATLDVTFLQVDPIEPTMSQESTSIAGGGRQVLKTSAGDTLAGIAHRMLGDARRWRDIADANKHRLTNLRHLVPGMDLVIPND